VHPATISADDVRSYVDANLARLQRFIDRELYFRHTAEDPPVDGLSTEEVVDEVICQALSDGDRPEKMALEPWLYHLAMNAMKEMSAKLNDMEMPVHLEDSRRRQNVEASDEAVLQFHQPDEGWTKESSIPDRRLSTPEQSTYSDEMVALVQAALRGADRVDREAFLLYGIEGFSLSEIAVITGRHQEAVRESIENARQRLRGSPSVANEFYGKVVKTGT
jgi:RNA polymerase sigma factor (sigma-70 family)